MSQLDTLYRAIRDYRLQTAEDKDCSALKKAIAEADPENDLMQVEYTVCTIEEDWIVAIEEGLVFIEKAIKEERQFIRTNGEVLPIERVKHVSKESIAHLAKHSDLITDYDEEDEDDLIPEKLYTTEKLSDFAVYENRFLYMLLCYLRDFISLRYNKILELSSFYSGKMTVHKTMFFRNRKLTYDLELTDENKNDPFLRQRFVGNALLDRIDLILKAVMVFLGTPLMQEVGKVAMLKPPITKTNVLKMNHNFKGCVALYEYICAYNKPGYSVQQMFKTLSPLKPDVADEVAETISLQTFLLYQHGMDLEHYLKERFDQEEQRRKELAEQKHLEQLRILRKRIDESGNSPEEYMLALERRNRMLENDRIQLGIARQKIEEMQSAFDTLTEDNKQKTQEIEELNQRLVGLEHKYEEDMYALRNDFDTKIADLNTAHNEQIVTLNAAHAEEVQKAVAEYRTQAENLIAEHEQAVNELNAAHEQAVADLKSQFAEERNALNANIDQANQAVTSKNAEVEEMNARIAAMEDKVALTEARLNALRKEYKLFTPADDFTEQDKFEEIEHQYNVFKKFFDEEWRKTKKRIRRECHNQAVAEYNEEQRIRKESQTDNKD